MKKIAEKMQRKPVYQTPGACASDSCSSMGWLKCTWQDRDRQRTARPQVAQRQTGQLQQRGPWNAAGRAPPSPISQPVTAAVGAAQCGD